MAPHISRQAVYQIWVENDKSTRFDVIYNYVLQQFGNTPLPDDVLNVIKITLRSFCQKLKERWEKSYRYCKRFTKSNLKWLEEDIIFPDIVINAVPDTLKGNTSARPGRPQKPFLDSCLKTKKRKVQDLVQSTSKEMLFMATEKKNRQEGKKDSATIVRELSLASPNRGTTIKKARQSFLQKPKILSGDQALAIIVDSSLSTHQYNTIRHHVKDVNSNLYPPYYVVKYAKQSCYPTEIKITETSAEIKLQSLIDHTIQRLLAVQAEVCKTLPDLSEGSFHVIIKWGCDGADQNRYKQKFSEQHQTDESLFSISLVPIQIYFQTVDCKKNIWHNPAPSSVRYCRPIKFIFVKESPEVVTKEVKYVQDQCNTLFPTKVMVNDMEVLVKATLIFCMIDGKVCNAVASCSSSQRCYLCGATPRQMNKPEIISQKSVDKNFLSFGLSPLHSWIRFLECILHISYRLEIKLWQARGPENKTKVAQKKKEIQDRFKNEMGLLVDMPKQKSGNSNDGNTARRFFRNAEKSAEITSINVELIKRFHVILECLGSGFPINSGKFEEYARETRELYLKEYSWYAMPVTVHKVLYHGKDVIASCILPIGQLSEEAQEARNKNNRQYRQMFTRKTSRVDTNTDLLHRLLISSDPLIASLRQSPKTKRGQITPAVLNLLSFNELETTEIDET